MTPLQTFTLPQTVTDYLTNGALRTGVDALADVPVDTLPPDLAFDELSTYYAARSAAELIRFDFAAALWDLWRVIWAPVIPSGWTEASPSDLIEDEYSVTPEACWDEDAIALYHCRGDYYFSTAVSFDAAGSHIGFSVERKTGRTLEAFDPFTWRDDKEWSEWLVYSLPHSPADPNFALDDLKAKALLAAGAAEAFVKGR